MMLEIDRAEREVRDCGSLMKASYLSACAMCFVRAHMLHPNNLEGALVGSVDPSQSLQFTVLLDREAPK